MLSYYQDENISQLFQKMKITILFRFFMDTTTGQHKNLSIQMVSNKNNVRFY